MGSFRSQSSSNLSGSKANRPVRAMKRAYSIIDPGRATFIFKEAPVFDE
jgi:hypothetical protein